MFARHRGGAWLALIGLCALLLLSSSRSADAFSSGQFRHSGSPDVGGATCANCHDGAEQSASVSINGPTSMRVGESATFTVTVQGGPGVVAGFNAATGGLAGSIVATSASTQVISGEATHASATSFDGNRATFTFDWTAPADPATVDWYVAAVSADGGGSSADDAVATTSRAVIVEAAPTPTPTPTAAQSSSSRVQVTVEPTATPIVIAAERDASLDGPFGFALNPQAAAAPESTLAVTGAEATGYTAIAIGLLAAGATLSVGARRLRRSNGV